MKQPRTGKATRPPVLLRVRHSAHETPMCFAINCCPTAQALVLFAAIPAACVREIRTQAAAGETAAKLGEWWVAGVDDAKAFARQAGKN